MLQSRDRLYYFCTCPSSKLHNFCTTLLVMLQSLGIESNLLWEQVSLIEIALHKSHLRTRGLH